VGAGVEKPPATRFGKAVVHVSFKNDDLTPLIFLTTHFNWFLVHIF
jgi:hypothetical protein